MGTFNGNVDQGDAFWFSDNNSQNTWVGCMEDDEAIPEDEIALYIKNNNPTLFRRLRALPLKSTDIPLTFYGQRTLQRLGRSHAHLQRHNACDEILAKSVKAPSKINDTVLQCSRPHSPASEWSFKETRNRIEHKLNNGFSLYQHSSKPGDVQPLCGFALCKDRDVSSYQCNAYYSLLCDQLSGDCNPFIYSTGSEFYCDLCFSSIFPAQYSKQPQDTRNEMQNQLSLDGIDRKIVLAKADRLCPKLTPRKLDRNEILDKRGYPDHAFNYPSNSPKARRLREHKEQEMNTDLAEVARYERAVAAWSPEKAQSRCRSISPDSSVLIVKPMYMESKRKRYKKQGLVERREKEEPRRYQDGNESTQGANASVTSLSKSSFDSQRCCYCKEADNRSEMLKCTADLCPIGWFHLQCTRPQCPPRTAEKVLCCYCSDGTNALITQPILDKDNECTTEPSNSTAEVCLASERVIEPTQSSLEQEVSADNKLHDNNDFDQAHEDNNLRGNPSRWTAINDTAEYRNLCPETESSLTHSTSINCSGSSSPSTSIQSCSKSDEVAELADEGEQRRTPPYTSDNKNNKHTKLHEPNSSPSQLASSSSSSSNNLSSPASGPALSSTLSTPPLTATFKSSKPWGTPINLPATVIRHEESDAASPLSAHKRRSSRRC